MAQRLERLEQLEQLLMEDQQNMLIPKQEEPDQNYETDSNCREQRQSLAPRVPFPGLAMTTCTRLNIVLKKAHICGEWKWLQGGEDTCGICRMEFESACNMCKFPGDECPLVVGTCRHAFHRHCIDKWITSPTNAPKAQCPLCRQDWVAADTVIEIRD